MLLVEGSSFPVIQEVYDPLSRRRNGTITPQAPIYHNRMQFRDADVGKHKIMYYSRSKRQDTDRA